MYTHMRKRIRGKREKAKTQKEYNYQSGIMNNKRKIDQ